VTSVQPRRSAALTLAGSVTRTTTGHRVADERAARIAANVPVNDLLTDVRGSCAGTWAGAPQLADGSSGELGLPSSRVVA
jgi:hypothetical protein